jgi:hypothetical protein
MTDSSGSQDPAGPDTAGPDTPGLNAAGRDRLTREASLAPAQAAPAQYDAVAPVFPPTETVGQASYQPDPGGYPELRRYGPGVPGAGPAVLSADEIWRTGHLPASPSRGRWWRWAGSALSVALLIASGVLIYQRLHHGTLAQQVTLQVLGPGPGTAAARVTVSC